MAKKDKEIAKDAKEEKKEEGFYAVIKKKYGDGLFLSGQDLIDRPRDIISVSPRIDLLTNGGITSSSWNTIIGPAKWGKTSLALRIAEKAQKFGYFILFANIENRLKQMNLEGTKGLDYKDKNKFMVLQSTKENFLDGEKYLGIMEDVLKGRDKVLIIADSLSTLAHPRQSEGGVGTATRGAMGTLTAQFVNNMCPIVNSNGHIIINILQQYANTSGFGKSKNTGGGTKVIYQSDCTIEAVKKVELKDGERVFGQCVTWDIDCSSLGAIPGTKVDSYIKYGVGVYAEMELVDMAKEVGIIEVSGSWLSYNDIRIQGTAKFSKLLEENKALYDELYKKVMDSYKALREE